ncbi:unnamed protein product [Ixodes hexagonus]
MEDDPRPYKDSLDSASQGSGPDSSGDGPEVRMRLDLAAAAREPLKVYLRLRPRALGRVFASPCLEPLDDKTLISTATMQDNQQRKQFTFTKASRFSDSIGVFPELSRQEEIFEEVVRGPLESFLAGHNVLLFAYGPTGSGKTYTMQGTPEQPGIIPRTLDRLFRLVGQQLASRAPYAPLYFNEVRSLSGRDQARMLKKCNQLLEQQRPRGMAEYSTFLFSNSSATSATSDDTSASRSGSKDIVVWVSCYEIYNENIYDLLLPIERGQRPTLKLGEDHDHRAYVKNLTEVPVQTAEDAYALLCVARRNLSIAETRLNQSSSRSHCMFNVRVVRCNDAFDGPAVSCLTLCDLAGSENPTKTGNMGCRLREAGRINTSLLVLGRCLESLRQGKGAEQRAPFRDSKLTQVMQAFFVGGGIVSLVVNVSPSLVVLEESLGALKFSAVATAVVPIPAESRHSKCRAAVRRLTQVWQRSTRSDCWSDDDNGEEVFDGDQVAELFDAVQTLQQELEKAQGTIEFLDSHCKAKDGIIAHLEKSQLTMRKINDEAIKAKVRCAKVYTRLELDEKYRKQRRELVKARKEIALLRGDTQPPRLSDVLVPGDSEDDSDDDESADESADEPTSQQRTTNHDEPQQSAATSAAAEVEPPKSALQAEVKELRAQLEAALTEKELLQSSVAAFQAEWDASLDSASQLDSLRQELADARMEREQAERDTDKALEQLQELREEHQEALASVGLLKEQLAAITQAQETGAQELSSLAAQYQQQLDLNASINARLAEMTSIVQNTDTLRRQVELLKLQLDEASEKLELAESGKLGAEDRLTASKAEHERELEHLRREYEATQRTTTAELQSKVDDLTEVCAELKQKWMEAEASREKACSDSIGDKKALSEALAAAQAALTLKEGELEHCKEELKSSKEAVLLLLQRVDAQQPKLEEIVEEVDENDESGARRKTTATKSERPRRQTRQAVDPPPLFEEDKDFVTPRRVTRSRVKKSSVSMAEQNRSVLSESNTDTSSSPLQRFAGYVVDVFSRASTAGISNSAPRASRLVKADPDFVDLSQEDPTPCRKSSRRARK